MPEEQLVEAGPWDLKRARGGCGGGRREVGVLLDGGVVRPEAGAPFLDEPLPGDRVVDPEGAEQLVGPGKLRLADVKAREHVAFQHQHAPAGPRQSRGHARAARPSADDGDVVVPVLSLDTHRADLARGRMQTQTRSG